jgi:hypothetical protein
MKQTRTINKRLLDIIQNDYDGCEWLIISASELMETINHTIEMFKNNRSFDDIKDSIGQIGIGISDVEKCLDGVEECYSRMVEELSNDSKIRSDD